MMLLIAQAAEASLRWGTIIVGSFDKKSSGYLIRLIGLYKGEENQHRGTFHVKAQLLISIAH